MSRLNGFNGLKRLNGRNGLNELNNQGASRSLKLYGRRGSITILILVVLIPILTILLTTFQLSRRQTEEVFLVRAARSQLQASIAQFDPDLFAQFGLLGVANTTLDTDVYERIVPDRYQGEAVIQGSQWLKDPKVLSNQINRFMWPRIPLLIAQLTGEQEPQTSNETALIKGVDNLPDLQQASKLIDGPLEPVLDALQNKLLSSILDGLADVIEPELKASLSDLLGQLDEISDLRQNLSSDSKLNLDGLTILSQTINASSANQKWLENPVLQKFILAEYGLSNFNRSVQFRVIDGEQVPLRNLAGQSFADLSPERADELEQILTGLEPDSARKVIRAKLLIIRSVITLADYLNDETRMAEYRTLSVAAAAALSALSGATLNIDPEILAWLFAVGDAINSGNSQTSDLLSGQAVPLIPETLLGQASDGGGDDGGVGGGDDYFWGDLKWYYSDYLRLFLIVLPGELCIDRMGNCIEAAMGDTFAVELSIMVQTQDRLLPGPSQGQHTFEMKLAYAD